MGIVQGPCLVLVVIREIMATDDDHTNFGLVWVDVLCFD